MDERWSHLKRLFQDDGDILSAEQRSALGRGRGAGAAWQTPTVRFVPEAETAAAERAPRSAAGGDTWVVTSADSRFWHFLTCFLASLRDVARYHGRLAVIDYGLTEGQQRVLQAHGVLIVRPRRRHVLVIDRYLTLAQWFRGNPNDRVFYFDADIWFADSVDELLTNPEIRAGKLGAAKDVWECDYYLRCTNPEHHPVVREALVEVIRDCGQTLQAGFIAGSTTAWWRYASLLSALLTEGFANNTWGTDALALNFYAQLYKRHFLLLPITYNAPPLWGVVREGSRFFATKFDTDSSYRPEYGRIPVKAIHCTAPVRHRTDVGVSFADVYPEVLEEWRQRLGQ